MHESQDKTQVSRHKVRFAEEKQKVAKDSFVDQTEFILTL